jgi:uncharacterized protein
MVPDADGRTAIDVVIGGARLQCLLAGAVYWPERRMLILADLHFEKSTSRATRGQLLPPYDTRATLDRLETLVTRYRPATVLCLGDSLHDRHAAARLAAEDRQTLERLTRATDWLWITGNHDPEGTEGLGGQTVTELSIDTVMFRHEADPALQGPGEISGHYHPAASVGVRGTRLRGRCFVEDGRRMILPAFGQFTGGLDIRTPVYQPLFPAGMTAHLIGRERLLSLPYTIAALRD